VSWSVEFSPSVEWDINNAADWYDVQQSGLGSEFIEAVMSVADALSQNTFLNSQRHSTKISAGSILTDFPIA
jgi:hypothetical protein